MYLILAVCCLKGGSFFFGMIFILQDIHYTYTCTNIGLSVPFNAALKSVAQNNSKQSVFETKVCWIEI